LQKLDITARQHPYSRDVISFSFEILKNAPIIILDEATDSLDATNETAVQAAINRLVKNRTVIVIAHKLKIVTTADNIIVLNGGRVIEQGTHSELIQNDGLYRKLYAMQQDTAEWGV
jgi:ATP-binding cassette subfamily B protein